MFEMKKDQRICYVIIVSLFLFAQVKDAKNVVQQACDRGQRGVIQFNIHLVSGVMKLGLIF
jgi:hypothetical protein